MKNNKNLSGENSLDLTDLIKLYSKVKSKSSYNILNKLYEEENNLLEIEPYEILEVVMNANKNIMSAKMMFVTRYTYSDFWDWCIANKYTEKENPFLTNQLLTKSAMIQAFADSKTTIKTFTPLDIDNICNKIQLTTTNETTCLIQEIIIRGIFEGIKNISDFAKIKMEDINFKDGTIRLNNKYRKFSKKLMECLKKYDSENETLYEKRGIHKVQFERYKTYFFKIKSPTKCQSVFNNDEEFLKKTKLRLNYYFHSAKQQSGDYEFTNMVLLSSGFIEYLRKLTEGYENQNSLMTCILFERGKNALGKTLKQLIGDFYYSYNLNTRSVSNIKNDLQFFLIKSPYFDPMLVEEDGFLEGIEDIGML